MSKKEKEKALEKTRKSAHAKFVGALEADLAATKVQAERKEKLDLGQAASEISAAMSSTKPTIKPKAKEKPKAEPVVVQPKVKETPKGQTCCRCKSFNDLMDVHSGRRAGFCRLHDRFTARKNSCKKWESR